ncbi:MAG: OsmC family peroxiredoxin [Betaproteobacteria bacterium HGW-Betaproteobacteria-4]|jgi:osmotically inducible protein OsmC|nr:MAG: OsmC family peroxiredoxin [Betaproteobacteria bacterium HGW-Betaproteobacteria-4]
MKRTASAAWTGGLQKGAGTISTQSGILAKAQYGFKERFEKGPGTNPEELIAAAHAGCFSMALAAQLEKDGMTPKRLQTEATVSFGKVDGAFSITAIHLDLKASVPGASKADLERVANIAKHECPVSKLLNAPITLAVQLETL